MSNPNVRLLAGCILLAALIAGYVFMQGAKLDPAPVLLFAGPLVTYLILGAKVDAGVAIGQHERVQQNAVLESQNVTLESQNVALATITSQTNGVLDARIKHAAGEAVIKHLAAAGRAADLDPAELDPAELGVTL